MIMRSIYCILFFCLVSIFVSAQETIDLKQIKLKSGVSITGYVTNNSDGSISITTTDGDQLWYMSEEIQSVSDDPSVVEARRKAEAEAKAKELADKKKAQEEAAQAKARAIAEAKAAKRAEKEAIKMKEKGFQFMIDSRLLTSKVDNFDDFNLDSDLMIDVSLVPCCRFNKHFLAGIGVGYKTISWNIEDEKRYDLHYSLGKGPYIKIQTICNFSTKRTTPYLGLNLGYSLVKLDFIGDVYDSSLGWLIGRDRSIETAENIAYYFVGGDLGLMFRSRRGGGLNLGLSLSYAPVPKSIHGISMENTIGVGINAGITF